MGLDGAAAIRFRSGQNENGFYVCGVRWDNFMPVVAAVSGNRLLLYKYIHKYIHTYIHRHIVHRSRCLMVGLSILFGTKKQVYAVAN